MSGNVHSFPLLAKSLLGQRDFLITVLDAIPAMVLVVAEDFTVQGMNARAAEALGFSGSSSEPQKVGEFLRCTNAVTSELGCGKTAACDVCTMREAVAMAIQRGDVFQQTVRMNRTVDGSQRKELYLVTATPFRHNDQHFVVLTMANLSQLEPSPELVAICAQCKKIRNHEEGWEPPEVYMSSRAGVDFSHTVCPDCLRALYPSLYKAQ